MKPKTFKKKKLTFHYNWQDSREFQAVMNRSKRVLSHAEMQAKFWSEEISFWQDKLKEQTVTFSMMRDK